MVQLSDEIIEEILCRLRVRYLLRFRCVSKSWLAIISNSYFIKLHLNQSLQTKSTLSRLFFTSYCDHFRVDFDSHSFLRPVKMNYFKLRYPNHKTSICGSCDGLLCIKTYGDTPKVFLWNPSTKKSIQLPYPASIADEKGWIWVYRFGYDNINNDYKVVKLLFPINKNKENYKINVYSLKSNSWHSPKKFPYPPRISSIGDSITSGAMHWISRMGLDSKSEGAIVAFDLGTEKYRVITPPELSGSHFCLYLSNLEGCLSAIGHYYSCTVDIFLLKEYGGKNEHWSKLITFSPTVGSGYQFPDVEVIAYSKCGKKILFLMKNRLVWYNLEQKSEEDIGVYCHQVYTYMESIVSLDVPK
ncbi:F-box/kelch-repeat protein At3g06240-like [Impatiens glandulifera]|uniref:F-box/kelch-repeat protein At3g06240-like n=1 Tax=Impatiens glandulifera TaxID=253017 RepID=UPI001FB0E57F|nr:F-box/kelch-repeat protein At3g06240-like [Impatiens glandulifera]